MPAKPPNQVVSLLDDANLARVDAAAAIRYLRADVAKVVNDVRRIIASSNVLERSLAEITEAHTQLRDLGPTIRGRRNNLEPELEAA